MDSYPTGQYARSCRGAGAALQNTASNRINFVRPSRKPSPRAVYRLAESQRVNESSSLAQRFPKLKTLKVVLDYFDASGVTRTGGMTFKPNLEHAKSVFRFNCVNGDCVGGDYDLSGELSQAIASRRKSLTGELRCQGVRHNKEIDERAPCQSILRYKLSLGY